MTQSSFIRGRLPVGAALIFTFVLVGSAFGGVRFSGEELTPKSPSERKFQVIPYTLLTLERLSPLELNESLRGGLERAMMARERLIQGQQDGASPKNISALALESDATRQEILPELLGESLSGGAGIARSLLEWDEARIIYEEDRVYYKESLRRFKSCKGQCVEPEKPFPDYNDLIAGLEETMPPEDEPRMQVYSLYLRGLLYELSADEVGAVEVYREAVQIGQSRLIPEIHTRLGDLEARIGNFRDAAHEYGAVAFGEYYAESRVKQTWAFRQLRDCKSVLQVAARFRHTVSSEADQKRFSPEMLQYETECAAYYLRMKEVVEFDPTGVSLIEREIAQLKEKRRHQGSRTVVKDDLRICLADALQNNFEVTELSVKLGGTTRDPLVEWAGALGASEVDSDVPEPEEIYAANIAACMARRLEMFPVVTSLSGSVTLVVP